MRTIQFLWGLILFDVINSEMCMHKCKEPIPNHYHELGCTPVYNETNCCPYRFECPAIVNDGKCHINGQSYKLGEKLVDSDTPLCSAACYCSKTFDGMKFRCASIECPEVFNGPKPECIYQSQFDQCCGKYECNSDKITALLQKRCYLENKEYIKGQKMFSEKHGCHACICDDGFDNTTLTSNPHCQPIKCNIDILYADRVMAGCIPVYYGNAMCCPIGWRCPERQDEILPSNQLDPIHPNMTCKFGSLVLQVGDKISSENHCVECSCKIPPMAHCVQIGYC